MARRVITPTFIQAPIKSRGRARAIATNKYRAVVSNIKKTVNRDALSVFFEDVIGAIYSALTDPLFLITSAAVLYLIINFKEDLSKSPLAVVLSSFLTPAAMEVLRTQQNHALGALVMLPPILATKPRYRIPTACGSMAVLLMLPAQHLYVYSVAAFFGLLYLRMNRRSSKLFVVVIAAFLIYSQFMAKKPLFPSVALADGEESYTLLRYGAEYAGKKVADYTRGTVERLHTTIANRIKSGHYSNAEADFLRSIQMDKIIPDNEKCFKAQELNSNDLGTAALDKTYSHVMSKVCPSSNRSA